MDYSRKGVIAKRRRLNSYGGKIVRKIILLGFKLFLAGVIGVGICLLAGGIGLFNSILAGTPVIHTSDIIANGQATIVYDVMGNEFDHYVGQDANRIEVTWDGIPKQLGLAFVAVEDERFYEHNGIDYKGMARAMYQFIRSHGQETQGASTITQQLLKNTVFVDWTEEGDNMIKKIKRKIQEQYLAIELTKSTEKDEVLLRYLNAINMGQNTLGVESASQRYFGKSAIDLNLSECAVLAAITQNPSWYNPIKYPENNVKRRKTCLDKMLELGFITQEEYDEAIADTADVYDRIQYHDTYIAESNTQEGNYFSDSLYDDVMYDLIHVAGYDRNYAEHMLTSGGLRIYSTMDPYIQQIVDEEFANPDNFKFTDRWFLDYALTIYDEDGVPHNFSKENLITWFKNKYGYSKYTLLYATQEKAQEAIDEFRAGCFEELGLVENEENFREAISYTVEPQMSMVIENQTTGEIVAIAGGRGEKAGRRTLNRATGSSRSPGSVFKVIASVGPGIDTGMVTLATTYYDAPFNYDNGKAVQNTSKSCSFKNLSLRYCIAYSMNIVAVKNLTYIGPEVGFTYLQDLGFTTLTAGKEINGQIYSDVNQSLALGGLTYGVTNEDVTGAYACIANGGRFIKPHLYSYVTGPDGNIILDNRNPGSKQVFKETTAWLLIDAMRDCVNYGTGSRVRFAGMDIAGKTGTTSAGWDHWFVGMTPYYTAGVWTGYDDNTEQTWDEMHTSEQLWRAVMSRVHEGLAYKEFAMPEGLIAVPVCAESGLLPIEGLCDGCVVTEWFAEGTEPQYECDLHYAGRICAYDGKIACHNCPFAYDGVVLLPKVDGFHPDLMIGDPSLTLGNTVIIENEDGTQTMNIPDTDHFCQHTDEMLNTPGYDAILATQMAQLEAVRQANEAAAAAAANASVASQDG